MKTITLVPTPQPGQVNAFGFGNVEFTCPDPTALKPGDIFSLRCTKESPNVANIGVQLPGEGTSCPTTYKDMNTTDEDGDLTVMAPYAGKAPVDVTQKPGIVIALGVYNSEQSPWPGGFRPCSYLPAPPPVPAAVPGLALLLSMIATSRTTHEPVAQQFIDGTTVSFIAEPLSVAPGVSLTGNYPDLSDTKSSILAQILGGTSYKSAPPNFAQQYPSAVSTPLINWIRFTYNGQQVKVVALQLVAAFDNENDVQAAIVALLQPA